MKLTRTASQLIPGVWRTSEPPAEETPGQEERSEERIPERTGAGCWHPRAHVPFPGVCRCVARAIRGCTALRGGRGIRGSRPPLHVTSQHGGGRVPACGRRTSVAESTRDGAVHSVQTPRCCARATRADHRGRRSNRCGMAGRSTRPTRAIDPQAGRRMPPNKGMKLTKLSAAATLTPQAALGRRCRRMPAPVSGMDAGTASQPMPGVRGPCGLSGAERSSKLSA
jgi:hypothetical protein